ncbi:hypothetical protein J4471_01385 [Candidatus Woesearchaeota archaeon]|nr:hypothetical protein [Candidatus Woesearchaeota archaeon]
MVASDFYELLSDLENFGFFDIALPFLLIFTILFAILEKTRLLGLEGKRPKTNINVVLALVVSFIVIANTEISFFIRSYLSNIGIIIIIATFALIVFGLLGVSVEEGLGGVPLLIAVIVAIVGILWALRDQTYLGINIGSLGPGANWDNYIIFIGIGFMITLIYFITKPAKSDGDGFSLTKLGEAIDNQLKGGKH